MPDCKPFSLLCTKNFLALAGAFLVTIAQGGAAYPGDCAECSVRRMSVVPGGVACPLCRRLTLPFVFFLAPIPPAPFPSGEGGDQGYFMQGASPLASPGLNRRRHGLNLRCRCPLWGLPGWSPADLAVPESVGVACPLCRRLTLPFVFFLAPIPPTPFPSGEGGDQGYFMQGASPPAPLH